MRFFCAFLMLLFTSVGCKPDAHTQNKEKEAMKEEAVVEVSEFGTTKEGALVHLVRLKNGQGMEVEVLTLGGIISRWTAADRNGTFQNVVLGFDNLEDYEAPHPFFGALVGRYGNRIAKGRFEIDGQVYQLPLNNGENHLHGGDQGFDKKIWRITKTQDGESASVQLSYDSLDGEMGYPGNLKVVVTYTLQSDNKLSVQYRAETDKSTVCNLTQHSYFNLSGDFSTTVLDHIISLNADQYVPVDEQLIPTGELASVDDTPFDLRESQRIGHSIEAQHEQIKRGGGYDHCWVIRGSGMRLVGEVYETESGRLLQVFSDQPGVQFYTGNFLDNTLKIPGGGTYGPRSGFCLETQHFPDSPNQPTFPNTLLRPGEIYETETVFSFSVR